MVQPFAFLGGNKALSASANSNSASGSGSRTGGHGSLAVSTSPHTVITAAGGTPDYTYAWAYLSGDTGLSATAPTAASTAFSGTFTTVWIKNAVWRCTITDSA